MTDPKEPDALTDDGRAPVLGEDQAGSPPKVDEGDLPKALDLPLEENDFNSQPG
jgi:hypothetical protein